jgi:MscS family membrane protein
MVRRFDFVYKGLIGLLAVALLWAIWASAQTNTGPAVIEFSRSLFIVQKNERNATITVKRSGNTNISCSVEFATQDPSAKESGDSSGTIEQITFGSGIIAQRISLPIEDHFAAAGNRRLKLLLRNPTPGAVLGDIPVAELQIEGSREAAWLTFGLNRVEPLQRLIFGIPLWQYFASLLYVFLAFYLSKLLDHLIRGRLRRLAAKTKTQWDDLLLELLRGPLKVITFVLLLHIGLRVFSWPEWTQLFLSKALKIVVAVSLTYMGLKLVDLATRFWRQRAADESDRSFNEQLLPIIDNTLKVFVVIVATLLTLQNLGLNITSLIASVSIGGLALSLAAQDTLANFFGALAVLLDKPFHIGDQIKLDGVEGTVETIGFRSTRVRNFDGFLVSIPNKTVGNATITNMSKRTRIRTLIDIGLAYDTPAEKVERALALLKEIFRSHPMTDDVMIGFNKFTDSALNIFVVHWWKNNAYGEYVAGVQQINLSIKQQFDQERIEFAFPTRTVYLKSNAEGPDSEPAGR